MHILISYSYFNHVQLLQGAPCSTINITGRSPSASELEELLDSPEQQSKTRDTMSKLNEANHLGTNSRNFTTRVRKHKKTNTMEGQVL